MDKPFKITEKEARRYYRIPPEALSVFVLAHSLEFPLFVKEKDTLSPFLEPGEAPRAAIIKLLFKLEDPEVDVDVVIRRADSEHYRQQLKIFGKQLNDIVTEELAYSTHHGVATTQSIDYSEQKPVVTTSAVKVGDGAVVGKRAPNFSLQSHTGETVNFWERCQRSPVLLVFYPGDFTPVCTKQLCNYRDEFEQFRSYGLDILGISANSLNTHKNFSKRYDIPFPLLSDPGKRIARIFKATSYIMLGAVSRAVFVVGRGGIVLYRYVEPTIFTRRKSEELLSIIADLNSAGLLDPGQGKNLAA